MDNNHYKKFSIFNKISDNLFGSALIFGWFMTALGLGVVEYLNEDNMRIVKAIIHFLLGLLIGVYFYYLVIAVAIMSGGRGSIGGNLEEFIPLFCGVGGFLFVCILVIVIDFFKEIPNFLEEIPNFLERQKEQNEARRNFLKRRLDFQESTKRKFETLAPYTWGKTGLKFSAGVGEVLKRLDLEFILDFIGSYQKVTHLNVKKEQRWRVRRIPQKKVDDKERAVVEHFAICDDGTEVVYKPAMRFFISNIDPEEALPEFVVLGGCVILTTEEIPQELRNL